MQPAILMIEPLTPAAERQLDAAYRVHRLFQADDPAKLVGEIGPSIRAVVTGGAHGLSSAIAEPGRISETNPQKVAAEAVTFDERPVLSKARPLSRSARNRFGGW